MRCRREEGDRRMTDSPWNVCGVSSGLTRRTVSTATHINAEKFDCHALRLRFDIWPVVPEKRYTSLLSPLLDPDWDSDW